MSAFKCDTCGKELNENQLFSIGDPSIKVINYCGECFTKAQRKVFESNVYRANPGVDDYVISDHKSTAPTPCPRCGRCIVTGDRYCSSCGYNLTQSNSRITVEIDTSDLDGEMELLRYTKGLDMALALWNIQQLFFLDDDEINLDTVKEIFNKYNINPDELVY